LAWNVLFEESAKKELLTMDGAARTTIVNKIIDRLVLSFR